MISYGNPQEVEEYFADGSVNQSYLKNLIKGVDYLDKEEKQMHYEEKGHFVIGSAVDVYLTQGRVHFYNQYYVFGGEKPSDSMMSIVKMVFDGLIVDEEPTEVMLDEVGEEVLLEALDYHKYQGRWKTETRINKLIEQGKEYFEQLKAAHGKQILSEDEGMLVNAIVMSLQSGEYTRDFFADGPMVDIYYQVPVYFVSDGIPCKILIDMLKVNRELKTIEPIDLKTMGGFTIEFPWAFRSRRYDIQASFYTKGILQLVRGETKCDRIETDLTGYNVKMFKFMVETTHTTKNKITDEVTYYTGKPMMYRVTPEQLLRGRNGRPKLFYEGHDRLAQETHDLETKPIRGYMYGLELHKWHTEHGFEKDKALVESMGIMTIE